MSEELMLRRGLPRLCLGLLRPLMQLVERHAYYNTQWRIKNRSMFKTPCHAPLCNIQTPTTCCITGGWYGYIQNPPLRTAPRSGLHQAGDTQRYLQAHPAPNSL